VEQEPVAGTPLTTTITLPFTLIGPLVPLNSNANSATLADLSGDDGPYDIWVNEIGSNTTTKYNNAHCKLTLHYETVVDPKTMQKQLAVSTTLEWPGRYIKGFKSGPASFVAYATKTGYTLESKPKTTHVQPKP
jgi:hypothetical protein